jgi:hypothetical protein
MPETIDKLDKIKELDQQMEILESKYDLKRRKEDLERVKLKVRYQKLILDVVFNLSALVAAAEDSTNDILSLFESFGYFSKFKNIT